MTNEVKEIIANWALAQRAEAKLPCPRCGKHNMDADYAKNSLSRRADIYICPNCGTAEALEDVPEGVHAFVEAASPLPLEGWFISKTVLGQPYQQKNLNGSFSVQFVQNITLTKDDVEDILRTAFVGGITSLWCARVEPLGNFTASYSSKHIAEGGEAKLYDLESEDTYILTAEKLAMGFHLWLLDSGRTTSVVCGEGIDTSEIDAEMADAIVQFAIFGEVMYA